MTRDPERDAGGPDLPRHHDLRLRAAEPADAPHLLAVSLRAIRGSAAGHYSAAQLEAWAATRSIEGHRRHVLEAQTFVVVDEEDAVVGFLTLRPVAGEPAAAEVDQLFVDPRAGGRGVARLLLDAAADAARSGGRRRILAHASWRAVPVFERCGYRRLRTETVHLGEQVLTRALVVRTLPDGAPSDLPSGVPPPPGPGAA